MAAQSPSKCQSVSTGAGRKGALWHTHPSTSGMYMSARQCGRNSTPSTIQSSRSWARHALSSLGAHCCVCVKGSCTQRAPFPSARACSCRRSTWCSPCTSEQRCQLSDTGLPCSSVQAQSTHFQCTPARRVSQSKSPVTCRRSQLKMCFFAVLTCTSDCAGATATLCSHGVPSLSTGFACHPVPGPVTIGQSCRRCLVNQA